MLKALVFPVILAILLVLPLRYFSNYYRDPAATSTHPDTPLPSTTADVDTAPTRIPAFPMYPALYICHGAGPLPVLGTSEHTLLADKWREHTKAILAKYGPPKVIAVVSAHYNTAQPSVGGGQMPEMLYDYGGFPKESYSLKYPAAGHPALAQEMVDALKAAGMDAQFDVRCPYDHGVFVPLLATFPKADIPVVPISVVRSDDPAEHIRMGLALRPFRERGVFFLGSGSSMHHFGNFDKRGAGDRFGNALTSVLQDSADMTPEKRLDTMRRVSTLDGFDEAQPRGAHEHLMPLLTLVGTAEGRPAKEIGGKIDFFAASVRHYIFEEGEAPAAAAAAA